MLERPLVYILDDQETVLEALRRLFEGSGFEVRGSVRWSEVAQRLVAEKRPAVFVCDLSLVGIRGEDLCRTIVGFCKTVKIVLFSTDRAELEGAAGRLGVRAVFKGDGLPVLLDVVRELSGMERPARPEEAGAGSTPAAGWFLAGEGGFPPPLRVTTQPLRFGRGEGSTVVLPHPSVSRHHAEVVLEGEHPVLIDRSRNGTWVDGARVTRTTRLTAGATIEVGPYSMVLLSRVTREEAQRLAHSPTPLRISLPGGKLGALLVFLASTEIEGRISFVRAGDADENHTQIHEPAGVLDVRGPHLVAARHGELTGVTAARLILQDVEACVHFRRKPVGPTPPDTLRVLDLLDPATSPREETRAILRHDEAKA